MDVLIRLSELVLVGLVLFMRSNRQSQRMRVSLCESML